MKRVSKIVIGPADLLRQPDHVLTADGHRHAPPVGSMTVAMFARTLGVGTIWAVRKAVRWGAGSRVASFVASALSPIDRRRAMLLKGTFSQLRNGRDDHAQFWAAAAQSYPSDPSILRMRIHSALRSGDGEGADTWLGHLINSGFVAADDARFVVGLANIDLHSRLLIRTRFRIRRFLASLHESSDRRVAAVELGRVIFGFPRKSWRSSGHIRTRFLHLLDRSAVWREPKQLLHRVARCEKRIEELYPGSLFETDILAAQRGAFIKLVRNRLREQRPFSFVRLGDGEAACLPYEPSLSFLAAADAHDRERIWWGKPLDRRSRSRIYRQLARAMFDADCIGIPTIARFVRELKLQRHDTLETTLTGRGLRAVLHCAENWEGLRCPDLDPPIFVSCHLHQHLELWNCYGELLDGVNDVVLVSCHKDIPDWMHKRFGVTVAAHVLLPPDRVTGPHIAEAAGDRALPAILDTAIDALGDLPRRRLVLVGAGLPGKLIVAEARARGGVALDIGSIFDHWLGLKTRSYLDLNTA